MAKIWGKIETLPEEESMKQDVLPSKQSIMGNPLLLNMTKNLNPNNNTRNLIYSKLWEYIRISHR